MAVVTSMFDFQFSRLLGRLVNVLPAVEYLADKELLGIMRVRDGCESKKGAAEQRRNPELTRRFGGMRVGWGSQLQHVESFRGKIHAEENRLFNLTHFAIFTCGSEAVPQV